MTEQKKSVHKGLLILCIVLVLIVVPSAVFFSKTKILETLNITMSDLAVTDIFEYDGQEVQISGYISPYSPSDGSFIYLMSVPYDSKPCDTVGNGKGLSGLHVFPTSGMCFVYTAIPVTVKGTVAVNKTLEDIYGIRYDWSLQNSEVMSVNSEYMNEDLYTYSEMVSYGLLDTVLTGFYAADYDLHYKNYGADKSELQVYDTEGLAQAIAFTKANNRPEYKKLTEIAQDIKGILDLMNTDISEGSTPLESAMYETYVGVYNDAYTAFYDWLSVYSL